MAARLDFTIRDEVPADHFAIADLTRRAFAGQIYSDGTEADIIDCLRNSGGLKLSLVALINDRLVGHVAFSPATPANFETGWFALGPISVDPELQRRGIGTAMVAAGFERLKSWQARGCILVGNPSYYGRFGFEPAPLHCPPGQPPEYFMMACFGSHRVPGTIDFHPAFYERSRH